MTSAIETNLFESVERSGLPYDFYREVHKGLRRALFTLTAELGASDYELPEARAHAVLRVSETVALLHGHHHHEDEFFAPLLAQHNPRLAAIVDAGHAESEAQLAEIDRLTQELAAASGPDAVRAGLDLYRFVALFIAQYLAHMALEEGEVMTSLRNSMDVVELFDVDMRLRGSIPPDAMCRFIAVMVPAMNSDERLAMLRGMHAGAPAEIFDRFLAVALGALDADAAAALERRLSA